MTPSGPAEVSFNGGRLQQDPKCNKLIYYSASAALNCQVHILK